MAFRQSELGDSGEGFVRLVFACNAAEWAEAKSVLRQYQLGGGSKLMSWVMFVFLCAAGIIVIWWRTKQLVPPAFQFYVPAAAAVLVVSFLIFDRWKRARQNDSPFMGQLRAIQGDALEFPDVERRIARMVAVAEVGLRLASSRRALPGTACRTPEEIDVVLRVGRAKFDGRQAH